jgi:hypothetical protein
LLCGNFTKKPGGAGRADRGRGASHNALPGILVSAGQAGAFLFEWIKSFLSLDGCYRGL